ncbi:hypothetical protein ACKI2N_012795 [Cupriavidus sp. 30B13]|uniref:hypothetical protein n=1 Tax=Cupriavidus sp. 30B13 TaxID=3384241 RepID=UPI003B8FA1C9
MKLDISIEFTPQAEVAAKDIALDLAPYFGAHIPVTGDLVRFPGLGIFFVVAGRVWQGIDRDNVELRVMLDLHDRQPLAAV